MENQHNIEYHYKIGLTKRCEVEKVLFSWEAAYDLASQMYEENCPFFIATIDEDYNETLEQEITPAYVDLDSWGEQVI